MVNNSESKYIYLLYHESSDKYYVGQAFDVVKRFRLHLRSHGHKGCENNKKDNWIKSLLKKGVDPRVKIICKCPTDQADFFEIFYIDLFIRLGFELVNGTLGGSINSGGLTEETKKKISESNKGKKMSQEHNYRLHQVICRGRKAPLKEKLHISMRLVGNKFRAGAIPANKGKRKLSKETVEQIRLGLAAGKLGKDLAAEFNTNISTISCIRNNKYYSDGWGYESSNDSWKQKDKTLRRENNFYLFS